MNAIEWTGHEYPVSRSTRVMLILAGLLLLAGFGLARSLQPDPRGYGTHRILGLPECTFQKLFQGPCPGCGMTTSFAHFTRGNWQQSFAANPAGLLLAVICAGLIPWCWWSASSGRMWVWSDPWVDSAALMAAWGGLSLIVWLIKWFGA